MAFQKSPPWLKELFADLIADFPVEPRQMFGFPCCFANTHLCAGLFEDQLMMRLSPTDRGEMLSLPGASIFDPMGGRPMKEYAVVPPEQLEDSDFLRGWLERSIAYVMTLPPKPEKTASKKRAKR